MTIFTLQRRAETKNSTRGEFHGPDGKLLCSTLERGEANPDHTRISAGTYKVVLRPLGVSEFDRTLSQIVPGYKGIPWLCDVAGRTNIEIHPANYFVELLGCIAPASQITTATSPPGFMAVQSRDAFKVFYAALLDALAHSTVSLVVTDIVYGEASA